MFLFRGTEFVQIEPDKFIEDMFVVCNVYYRYKNELFLIITSSTLASEPVDKIKKMGVTYDGIYIESKYLNDVLREFFERQTKRNNALLDYDYINIGLKLH